MHGINRGWMMCRVVVMVCGMMAAVVAQGVDAAYLSPNADGSWETKTANCTAVTTSTITFSSGWYVVNSSITNENRITVNGDVHLILADDCELNAIQGLKVEVDTDAGDSAVTNSLTIYAQSMGGNMGKLLAEVTTDGTKAGIGSDRSGICGSITINGGLITARGGHASAGIGGALASSGGMITITGGTVSARGGLSGNGIGSGLNATEAATFATGEHGSAFIVASSISDKDDTSDWRGVIFEGNEGLVYGTNITLRANATISEGYTLTIKHGQTLTIAEGVTLTNDGAILNYGTMNHEGTIIGCGSVVDVINVNYLSQSDGSGALQMTNALLVVRSDFSNWSAGWYVVTNTVSIANRITVSGDVHLILADGCELNATQGITVQEDDSNVANGSPNSLTIYAQSTGTAMGKLIATGGDGYAGIGGNLFHAGGTILITGGKITATSGSGGGAAGIGGGDGGAGGTIMITGGAVNATGGAVSLNALDVDDDEKGGGAGIGGGAVGAGGLITISAGTVTATGGKNSAGIGDGYLGTGGTFATGNNGAAFIVASSISDKDDTSDWSGVIFEGSTGLVYGDAPITLTTDATIPADHTLTIESGKTLSIAAGVTLTNNGTILNNGTIFKSGVITGTGTLRGEQYIVPDPMLYLVPKTDGTGWETKTTNNVTAVTASTTIFSNRWYVVQGAVSITNRIMVSGDVHLILADGCELNATQGITVQDVDSNVANGSPNSLTIYAQSTGNAMGKLMATGGDFQSGIGGGEYGAGGFITISGGMVTATGKNGGAGIGGGYWGAGGVITISGGTVTATGKNGGAGIGKGRSGARGTFSTGTAGNAFIVASSISDNDDTSAWRGVIFDGVNGAIYGTNIALTTDATIPAGHTLMIGSGETLTIAEGVTLTNHGTIFVSGTIHGSDRIIGNFPVIQQSIPYLPQGNAGGATQMTNAFPMGRSDIFGLSTGWYVVTNTVAITNRITVSGDVHLILANGCELNATQGITVQDDDSNVANGSPNSLTIYAQSTGDNMGKLIATGGGNQAVIGGGDGGSGGSITISGGMVTATGIDGGAVIGGGDGGSGGSITISGGTVTATCTSGGAGIGGGYNGAGGVITISGGTVTATGAYGAGIGGGDAGAGGSITISGGTVTATGAYGAGIGGGSMGAGGDITISGGTVTATGKFGAGIGGGQGGAGIGGGDGGSGGSITISGGTVSATGTDGGAGIGGGWYGAGGVITILGGTVTATVTSGGGVGIGGGYDGAGGTFSTGNNGNAFIVASSISDKEDTSDWRGVIFERGAGAVYGTSITLTTDATIPKDYMLMLTPCQRVTVAQGVTLTNNGTITMSDCACELCSTLMHAFVPSYVNRIASGAFMNCAALVNVIFLSETPPTIGVNAFATGTPSKVYVPSKDFVSVSNAYATAFSNAGMSGVSFVSIAEISPTIDTLDLSSLGATSGTVTLRLAPSLFSAASDNLRVLYWTALDKAPQTLEPSRYTKHSDGSITVEIDMPATSTQGFFRVQFFE